MLVMHAGPRCRAGSAAATGLRPHRRSPSGAHGPRSARLARADRRRGRPQLAARVGVDPDGLDAGEVAGGLLVEQVVDPVEQVLPGLGGEACGPPGRRRSPRAPSARRPWCRRPAAISRPVGMNAVDGEHGDHDGRPVALTAYAAVRATNRLSPPSSRTRSSTAALPVADQPVGALGEVGGAAGPAPASSSAAPAGMGLPAGVRPARRRRPRRPRSSVTSCDSIAVLELRRRAPAGR